MLTLTSVERRALRARAHALRPVVLVGDAGLSERVVAEVESALRAHELIKVRMAGEGPDARDAALAQLCDALAAAPVQHIGKTLVLYRPRPATPAVPRATARRNPRARKTKKSYQAA